MVSVIIIFISTYLSLVSHLLPMIVEQIVETHKNFHCFCLTIDSALDRHFEKLLVSYSNEIICANK